MLPIVPVALGLLLVPLVIESSAQTTAVLAEPPRTAPEPLKNPPFDPAQFVAVQRGELPILLSAPHGGAKEPPEVPRRTGEGLPKGPTGFFAGRDFGTEELAKATAEAIAKRMGKKPYFVIAEYHRRYCDANRPVEIAVESPGGRVLYDQYRGTLNKFCREVQQSYGRGLLLDIHGQGSAKDTVFRGTQNGKTCKLLIERFGKDAHIGPASFFGMLHAKGWVASPQGEGPETSGFTGGNIVQSYGSHGEYGLDAIQLEFGGDYRQAEKIAAVAETLAEVVADFAKLYLPEKK